MPSVAGRVDPRPRGIRFVPAFERDPLTVGRPRLGYEVERLIRPRQQLEVRSIEGERAASDRSGVIGARHDQDAGAIGRDAIGAAVRALLVHELPIAAIGVHDIQATIGQEDVALEADRLC